MVNTAKEEPDGLSRRQKKSGLGAEHVVPVLLGGPQALDSRIEPDHRLGHGFTGGVGIKAAVNWRTGFQELGFQPPTRDSWPLDSASVPVGEAGD
jgi:hypothetical protein